jgi:hypothetical protein
MAIEGYKGTLGVRTFVSQKDLTTGKVVQFTYDNEQKYALVLNPNWEGKMHALSLGSLTPEKLGQIFKLIGDETDTQVIYDRFKNSNFVGDRPYRTYLLTKISTLREVFIKKTVLKTEENVTENMYGE